MPWKTLCGFPPTNNEVTLRVPNGAWRPDTVITDDEGEEMFVLLDQTNEMRSYEAIFGDLDGRRLVCVKRHLIKAFWKDGFYFCTYRPNYFGQKPLDERDVDNKKLYPFSYLQVSTMKGRFFYCNIDNHEELEPPRLTAENPWLGYMVVCCTPFMGCGRFSARFRRTRSRSTAIQVDQWKNSVTAGPGNDLLAALCMAYVFDRYQSQPMITVFGEDLEDRGGDDFSIESSDSSEDNFGDESNPKKKNKVHYKDKNRQNQYQGVGPPPPGHAYPDQGDPKQWNPAYRKTASYRDGPSLRGARDSSQYDDDYDYQIAR